MKLENAIKILKSVRVMLGMEASFTSAKLADGSEIQYDTLEVGSAIFMVTLDGNIPAPVGEYTLEDGTVIKVDEEGKIGVITPVQMAEETPADQAKPEDKPEDATIDAKVIDERLTGLEDMMVQVIDTVNQLIEKVNGNVDEKMSAQNTKIEELNKVVEKLSTAPTLTSVLDIQMSQGSTKLSDDEIRFQNFKKSLNKKH